MLLAGGQSTFRALMLGAVLAGSFGLQACTSRPTSDNVAKFASSLDAVASGVRDAYALTAQVEREAAMSDLAVDYVTSRQGPIRLDPDIRFTRAQIEPVEVYLDLLATYAQQLAYLAGKEPVAKVDAAANGVAKAVDGFTLAAFPDLDRQLVERGLSGGQAIATFLVEEKLNRDLPPVVEQMQPEVSRVADLLNAQLGYLRTLLPLRIDEIKKSDQILLSAFRDDNRLTSSQRAALLGEAIARGDRLAQADRLLAAAQDTLPRMVRAHAALADPDTSGSAAAVEAFQSSARRLLAIYQAIK